MTAKAQPSWRGRCERVTLGAFAALQGSLSLSTGYLLALLLAARGSSSEAPRESLYPVRESSLRLVVLIPAHDEEQGITATLESLARCRYPSECCRIIVIADNCTDRTAEYARRAGAQVWERIEPDKRGKGFALAWALGRLQAELDSFDGVVIFDADCVASRNMLSAIDLRLRSGASAVQVNYVAGNPNASNSSALRFAGLALMNTVRFMGKQHLGLSCGLVGTGMGFTKGLLTRQPWTATSLAEDGEYHMRLVQAGEQAHFISGAWVSSPIPTSPLGSSDQQARWEQGKLQLIRHWSPPLVLSGLAKRDIVRLHAGLEQLVPPQSLISAGSIASGLVGLLLGSKRLARLSLATLAGQLAFVLGGLRLVRAPPRVYRALLTAPMLVLSKVALYGRLLGGQGPTSWVRTERASTDPADGHR